MQFAFCTKGEGHFVAAKIQFEQLLMQALERFCSRVAVVRVSLEDVNGPRGGVDKQCRCVVQLDCGGRVIVQDRDRSLGSLMVRVANRVAHSVSRQKDLRLDARRSRRANKRRYSETNDGH